MENLLGSILLENDNDSDRRLILKKEIKTSKKWVKLVTEVELATTNKEKSTITEREVTKHDHEPGPNVKGLVPKGFDGLGQKQTDLSQYIDASDLTDRQRDCSSMRWEYRLPLTEIARRLGRNRSTVEEHLAAARKRLQHDQNFQRALKKSAAHRGSHYESD